MSYTDLILKYTCSYDNGSVDVHASGVTFSDSSYQELKIAVWLKVTQQALVCLADWARLMLILIWNYNFNQYKCFKLIVLPNRE